MSCLFGKDVLQTNRLSSPFRKSAADAIDAAGLERGIISETFDFLVEDGNSFWLPMVFLGENKRK